ncbi:hypothetical protein [Plebeiibacterium sediminum]|uniref:Outer membrane protein beta-barrel domain-containing protein n=1 Tax=Plebeiibacterium sediminum TaxID=2992112 RepID=A0AAE3M963_9BACT|nr:hypothetical protein [Plebeiobacterium sediminum]MCW3789368.1 hypothetical protein [Plebeiobacterium sediminum]
MAKIVLISLLLLAFFTAQAQDKIVTTQNDTIKCKIVLINKDRILYELNSGEGTSKGKFLPLLEVAEYYRSDQPLVKENKNKLTKTKIRTKPDNRWCFGLNAGLSTMPWILDHYLFDSNAPDTYKNLDKGLHVNTSIHYMLSNALGIGAEYSFFLTRLNNETYKSSSYYNPTYIKVNEKFRQYVNYVGPSILFQQYVGKQKKITLRESLSAGAIFYRLENQSIYPTFNEYIYYNNSNNSLITGNTSGAKIGLAAEYKFSKHISIGLSGDFIWSPLETADFESKINGGYSFSDDNVDLDDPLNLSRLDYSIVLHYTF